MRTRPDYSTLEGRAATHATRSLQVAHEGMEDDVAFILCLASDSHSVLAQATLMLDDVGSVGPGGGFNKIQQVPARFTCKDWH